MVTYKKSKYIKRKPYGATGGRRRKLGGVEDLVGAMGRMAIGGATAARRVTTRGYAAAMQQRRVYTKGGRDVGTVAQHSGNANSSYNQITYHKSTTGKKLPQYVLDRKLTRASRERVIYRFQRLKVFDDNGSYFIGQQAVTASGATILPLYALDMTAVRNIYTNSVVAQNPLFRATMESDGDIVWTSQNGQTALGVDAAGIQLEESPVFATAGGEGHNRTGGLLAWTQLKMALWGAKSRPVKFKIQIVKFIKQYMEPNLDTTTLTTAEKGVYNDWWQSYVKPLTFSPLCPAKSNKGVMKVLKAYSFAIDPQSSDEADQDPSVKILNIFNRWNRYIEFNEQKSQQTNDENVVNSAQWQTDIGENSSQAHPKHRIFMIVSAQSTSRETDTETNNISPSFDLVFRSCWQHLG